MSKLLSDYPDLILEWSYEKNDPLKPEDFSAGSNKKVWWKCSKCGYEWKAVIGARTGKKSSGCPACSNRVVVDGLNDLASNNPELSKQFDVVRNGIRPNQIIATSAKKVWWICDKGHCFEAKIYDRNVKGHGCPYCINQRFKPEYNSLAVLNPRLADEFDEIRNAPLTPLSVICGGNRKLWWKCKKEPHSYLAKIGDRLKGSNCPYCSSEALLIGFNDLATKNPEVAAMWDYEKNGDLTPSKVMSQSNIKVWWKCPDCGNSWHSGINNVSGSGTRCPICSTTYKVSEAEQIVYYYLSLYFEDVRLTYKPEWLGRGEIDIYVPSLQLAIEYDGEFWHKKTSKRDIRKTQKIKEHGLWLVRLREEKLPPIDDDSICIEVPTQTYNYDRLSLPIVRLFESIAIIKGIDIHPDIDVERDWKKILAKAKTIKVGRSIVKTHPEIARLWDYEKNGGLKPEQVFAGSNKKVWWKCPDCGYEWEAIVVNMTKRNTRCPACIIKKKLRRSNNLSTSTSPLTEKQTTPQNRRLIRGLNDLKTVRPDIASEWNYSKNAGLLPEQFSVGSSRSVWWKCSSCDYEWKTSIANRKYGYGCPKCGKLKAAKTTRKTRLIPGKNDLATVNPFVASQWYYEKNGNLTPESINSRSNLDVWWKCEKCGNEWHSTACSRRLDKHCPYCINKRFKKGYNDIFSKCPELEDEWDYKKNTDIDPEETIHTSQKKVWWKCKKCGHEWKTTIYSRTYPGRQSGCPICNHRDGTQKRSKKIVDSRGSFGLAHPEIAEEWMAIKNGDLTPYEVSMHSGQKYWWKCKKCGFEWEATPNHRSQGTSCPMCQKRARSKKRSFAVRNIDTLEIFESASSAAEAYPVSAAMILKVCRGECAQTKGTRWEFAEK